MSERADVPRTRVYDAADELSEWGLIDVEPSIPQRFVPVSADTASELLDVEFTCRINLVGDMVRTIESIEEE